MRDIVKLLMDSNMSNISSMIRNESHIDRIDKILSDRNIIVGSSLVYIGTDTDTTMMKSSYFIYGNTYFVTVVPTWSTDVFVQYRLDGEYHPISVGIETDDGRINITDHFLTIQEYREQVINQVI